MSLTEADFEKLITDHLTANGYTRFDPHDLDASTGLFVDELLAFVRETQPEQWDRLVERHGSESLARDRFAKRVATQLDSADRHGVVDLLRHGVSDMNVDIRLAYFAPAHGLTPDVAARYGANRLGAVRQLDVGGRELLDLTLTVNGIPVATAELKTELTGQSVEHAVHQYRTDRNPHAPVLRRAAVHFAVDTDRAKMTTRLAGEDTTFLPFNRGDDGRAGNPAVENKHRTHYLWEQVWQRDAWLDILGRFVHTETDEAGNRITIFPRYHQWDAVLRLVADTRANGAGRRYLVQHSAGSGKSNTIAWLAHRLANLHDESDQKTFDKVVVVTDRTVLDSQLADTIWQFEHTHGLVNRIGPGAGAKSERLAAALTDAASKIVIVTLQTFPFVMDRLAEIGGMKAGGRYAVIADEAHSSQTGLAAAKARAVLTAGDLDVAEQVEAAKEVESEDPQDRLASLVAGKGKTDRLSFYAFTATPKQKTRELFGTLVGDGDGARYAPFHTYTMRQAIEEGFILDVLANYTTYETYWRIEKVVADDPEFDERRAKAAIARFVSLHPTNVAHKAKIIVDHFVEHTSKKIGGKAKAMVVTPSRLHAVRYQQAIDAYVRERGLEDQVAALVAFSGTVIDPPGEWTESKMNGFPESETARRFAGDDYQVLVVAEKFQTGFDQPLLHTMFVDKVLTGVNAVQTLSRLNRTHPGKEDTFVLDFRNDADDIAKAFAPFYETTVGVPTDPNVMVDTLDRVKASGVALPDQVQAWAEAVAAGGDDVHAVANALLDPAVDRFRALEEDDQEAFRDDLGRFVGTYSFLSLVVAWADAVFESWYQYGRALEGKIADHRQDRIDISDKVALTHLRMDPTFTGAIGVEPVEEVEGVWGRGPMTDDTAEALSVIVAELNERFGVELTEEHRLTLDQFEAGFAAQEEVVEAARANEYEPFKEIVFEPRFLETVIRQMDANEEIFKIILTDPAMRAKFVDYLGRRVFEGARSG